MPSKRHDLGHCNCKSHADRPWNRPEHWRADEVAYLEARFGRVNDAAIGRHLGRSVVGIRLKAKRLGLRKRDAGMSSRSVAHIFGVDDTTVSKVWIRRGLMRARRGAFRQGVHRMYLVDEAEVERFIWEHGEYVDVDQMPDSVYRDQAVACGRWYATPEVQRLTGRNAHVLSSELLRGRWTARKRGVRWMIHESQIEAIRATAGHRRLASMQTRERTLEHRRNVRKGIEVPRPHPLRSQGRPLALWWRVESCGPCAGVGCDTCDGKGRVMRNRNEFRRLPEEWAA